MPLHILDLPVDILALILTPLLVQADPIPLCPCGYLADSTTGLALEPLDLLPILLIHPAIHAISAPLFYQGNAFVLDLRGNHGPHVRRCLDGQAEDEAHLDASRLLHGPEDDGTIHRRRDLLTIRPALRRIRCLEMRIAKLRAWIDTQIVPFIKDMIVSGSLAELYIKISAATAGGSNSIFTRPPLAGLLAILSDPYLRTARLWVSTSAGHGAWQPFRLPCSTSAHGAGREVKGEEVELVQIDWARIVKMLDPEGRAVAVMTGGRT